MIEPHAARQRMWLLGARAAAMALQAALLSSLAARRTPFPDDRFLFIVRSRPIALASHAILLAWLAYHLLRGISGGNPRARRDVVAGLLPMAATAVLFHFSSTIFSYLALFTTLAVILGLDFRGRGRTALQIVAAALFTVMALATKSDDSLVLGVYYWALVILATAILDIRQAHYDALDGRSRKALWTATEFVQANLKLQYSAAISNEEGRQSERERLAREIHDTVGHSLTAMLMQVRVLRSLMRTGGPSSVDAEREAEGLEMALRTTIDEVRREVSLLREIPAVRINWVVRWRGLCRNFMESTGVQVTTDIPDLDVTIGEDLGSAVLRIVQESLTNSIRHGRSTLVDVTVRHKPEIRRLYLRISDNGIGAAKVSPGNGLRGIAERVGSLQGDVSWQTMPEKGFDIGVSLPFGDG